MQVPSLGPNSRELWLFLAGEWNWLSQPALLSFTIGLTHARNRVRKSGSVGPASDWLLSRRG